MEKELFTIYPLKGFGLLQFGQSVDEVRSCAPTYGNIKWDEPRFNEQRWLEFGELLREDPDYPEEKVLEMMEWYKEDRINEHIINIGAENIHIMLRFYKNQLAEIRMGNYDFPAYLGEQDLFLLMGEAAARYIAQQLQENPYLWEKSLFFVNHSIAIGDHFEKIDNGQIKWIESPAKPGHRSIFLTPPAGELVGGYGFDPETTPIYKVI